MSGKVVTMSLIKQDLRGHTSYGTVYNRQQDVLSSDGGILSRSNVVRDLDDV
jgi:hypothetical protein